MKRFTPLAAAALLVLAVTPALAWPRATPAQRRAARQTIRQQARQDVRHAQPLRAGERVFVGFDRFGNPVFIVR
jgi:hypothetical protein